eukprot:11207608-Lingulodinium_polyedra.AAC.1
MSPTQTRRRTATVCVGQSSAMVKASAPRFLLGRMRSCMPSIGLSSPQGRSLAAFSQLNSSRVEAPVTRT